MAERRRATLITRRSALRAGALGAVALGVGGATWFVFDHDTTAAPIDTAAMTALERSVVHVGERYLAQHPDTTETQLRSQVPAAVAAGADDPAVAFAALGTAVADDYAAGRTEVVDGWVLARCETAAAGLCTFAARRGRFPSQRS